MPENGFCDELPEDVLEMHERTARNLANLWSDGCDAARQAILAALCRETLRVSRSMPAPATLPFIKPESRNG